MVFILGYLNILYVLKGFAEIKFSSHCAKKLTSTNMTFYIKTKEKTPLLFSVHFFLVVNL